MRSYIVAGLGRFGSELARQLCQHGCEVLAVDRNSDLVQQIADQENVPMWVFSRKEPRMMNRMMNEEQTEMGEPKMPSPIL